MTEICKVIIESGFFFLAEQQSYYPHRRARWGNRLFLQGPSGTDWQSAVLRFRDFVRFSQTYYTQIDSLRYWVLPEPLPPDTREQDVDWGTPTTLWDNGGAKWPSNPTTIGEPHRSWSGEDYRGQRDGNRPLPPSVAYRYKRITPTLGGRSFYGYLRCVERRFAPLFGPSGGERLPFFVPVGLLDDLHSQQIAEPLVRSGLGQYHNGGSDIREVVVSHRGGVTSVHKVDGYEIGVTLTTARNFSLPVV